MDKLVPIRSMYGSLTGDHDTAQSCKSWHSKQSPSKAGGFSCVNRSKRLLFGAARERPNHAGVPWASASLPVLAAVRPRRG